MENYSSSQVKFTFKETLRNCINVWKSLAMVFVLFLLQQNTSYTIMTRYIIVIVDSLNTPLRKHRHCLALLRHYRCGKLHNANCNVQIRSQTFVSNFRHWNGSECSHSASLPVYIYFKHNSISRSCGLFRRRYACIL